MELKVIVRAYDCWGICSYLDPPFDVICVCVWRYSEYVHVRMLSPGYSAHEIPPYPSLSSPLLEEWQLQKPSPNDYNWLIGESLTSSASFNNPNMALKWL